jgi:hypothetical protein
MMIIFKIIIYGTLLLQHFGGEFLALRPRLRAPVSGGAVVLWLPIPLESCLEKESASLAHFVLRIICIQSVKSHWYHLITMEGFMEKKGRGKSISFVRPWTKRFFVLDPITKSLQYYSRCAACCSDIYLNHV